MSIAESLLPEFDQEMATTRKHLERTPAQHADWKPHPKSMSLGALAVHLTEVLYWLKTTLTQTEFDINPPGGSTYTPLKFQSVPALLASFDESVKANRAALAATSDKDFMVPWSLKSGGQALFTMPRIAVVRTFVLNHLIHHRGQFSVYLRLKDVAVPQTYGPTADETQ
jgi:uncharacterized damage-inducible protein DinB